MLFQRTYMKDRILAASFLSLRPLQSEYKRANRGKSQSFHRHTKDRDIAEGIARIFCPFVARFASDLLHFGSVRGYEMCNR
jgi:hypothetical protein